MDSSEVRTRSSFGCECVKHGYGQHLNLGNERSFRFGSAGIREASQTRAKKKQHFVAIPPFPYFLQVKRKRKTALLFNAVISRSLFCYMMANISHGNNRNNYTDS